MDERFVRTALQRLKQARGTVMSILGLQAFKASIAAAHRLLAYARSCHSRRSLGVLDRLLDRSGRMTLPRAIPSIVTPCVTSQFAKARSRPFVAVLVCSNVGSRRPCSFNLDCVVPTGAACLGRMNDPFRCAASPHHGLADDCEYPAREGDPIVGCLRNVTLTAAGGALDGLAMAWSTPTMDELTPGATCAYPHKPSNRGWEIDIESASRTIQATPRTANRH